MNNYSGQGPVLGLFAPSHMSYDIDRNASVQPSLRQMAEKAISLLSGNKRGFFLMVEGSRIDMAGHDNGNPMGIFLEKNMLKIQ